MPTYTPRLTIGNIYDANNPYYRTYNSFPYNYNTGMPNCTCYCYGRWNEISQVTSNPNWGFYGDGYDWYREGVVAGYQHDPTWNPQVGALISWTPSSGAGHVAVVEQVNYDSNNNPVSIVTSNSMYRREYGVYQDTTGCAPNFEWEDPSTGGGPYFPEFPFFFLDTIYATDPTQSTNVLYGSFNGFIYHPDFPPDIPPGPTPVAHKKIPIWAVSLPNRIRRYYGNRI